MSLLRISLPLQMAIATLAGILFGLFFGELSHVFAPWANAYIMILKITAIPYLVVAIMSGVGQLSTTQAKQILRKGIFFIGLAWLINITMIYLIVFLFPHAKGQVYGSYVSNPPNPINVAQLLIPENIFQALSSNTVPAVVIFSLLVGIALMQIKEKQASISLLQTIVDALTTMTGWIGRITPFGTFLIIANQAGTIQLETVKQVSTYIILYILGIGLIIFWIFPRLVSMLTSIPALKWIKDLIPILLLAYTTNLVIVCLPYIMQLIKREIALYYTTDETASTQIQGTVSIIFNLPLGSLFIALFVFFASIFYQTPLNIGNQIQLFSTTFLTGLGAVGLGAWINSLTFLVDTLGLPVDSLNLFLTTVPFTSGFQSMVSAMEITSLSLFITLACLKFLRIEWNKILTHSVIILIPVIVLVFGIKLANPLPPIQNETKSIYEIDIKSSAQATLYYPGGSMPPPRTSHEDGFDRILKTKILRVGYKPHVPPFCFFNNHKKLVGYDIAFAYQLAEDLDCHLELIPIQDERLIQDINSDTYDIAMSAISINEDRLKKMAFTRPYNEGKIILVTRDHRRGEFRSLNAVKANPDIKIAVVKGSSYELIAKALLPNKEIILIDNYDTFANCSSIDALLWAEPQAISWTLTHPHFQIVFPKPTLGTISLGYPVNENSSRLLTFLNQWLEIKKNEGFTEKQYDLWVLGKTAVAEEQEPRWSVIRNVLHWTKGS